VAEQVYAYFPDDFSHYFSEYPIGVSPKGQSKLQNQSILGDGVAKTVL
jgi:hypothetical protein